MKLTFLSVVFFVDELGWHVELDQRYVRSLLDGMAMNHRKSMATPGSRGQESNGFDCEAGPNGTHRVPI